MNPSQSKTAALPEYLYHGTSGDAMPSILKDGLRGRSYFTTEPVARWFAEQAAHEGKGDPVVLRVPIARLKTDDLDLVKRLLPGSLSGVKDIRIWRYLHPVQITEADVVRLPKTAESSIERRLKQRLGVANSVVAANGTPPLIFKDGTMLVSDPDLSHPTISNVAYDKDQFATAGQDQVYRMLKSTGAIRVMYAEFGEDWDLAIQMWQHPTPQQIKRVAEIMRYHNGHELHWEFGREYGSGSVGEFQREADRWRGKTAAMDKQAETDILVGNDDGDESTAYGDVIPTNQLGRWFDRYAVLGYEPFLRRIQQKHAKIATLEGIEVEEEARGKGVGDKLLRSFFNEARSLGATAVILVADLGAKQQTGFDLLTWYKKRGFERLGVRSVYPVMMLEFANVKKAAKADEDPAKNATTQINVPEEMAWRVQQAAKHLIPVEDLAGDGYEKHSHITLRYGLLEDEDAT